MKSGGYFSLTLTTILLSVAGISPSIASGSIIQYTFSGINPGTGLQTFQDVASNLLTPFSLNDFTKAELAYCMPASCSDVLFDSTGESGHGIGDIITFTESGGSGGEWFYDFVPGAFSTLGAYTATSAGNPGTLTVSVATPEPISAVLIFTGLLGLAWLSRRRTKVRSS
jgi:hypothetical protein